MKKLVLSFIAMIAISISVNAQGNFGLTGGANFSNYSGDDVDGVETKIGANFGVLYEAYLGTDWNLQPELKFSMQGAQDDTDSDIKFNTSYINIPVKFEYNATPNLDLYLGPQIGFLLSAEYTDGNNDVDIKDDFESTDFGLVFGAEYVSESGFGGSLGYNLGLSDVSDAGEDIKNSVFNVNLVYMLNNY